jgi:hypothetical protein
MWHYILDVKFCIQYVKHGNYNVIPEKVNFFIVSISTNRSQFFLKLEWEWDFQVTWNSHSKCCTLVGLNSGLKLGVGVRTRWAQLDSLVGKITYQAIDNSKLGSDYCRLFVLPLKYWQILANICYYCYSLFAKSFAIICYYCTRAQNVNYCNYSNTIIAIIDLYYQLFTLLQHYCNYWNYFVLLYIMEINLLTTNYCIIAINHIFFFAIIVIYFIIANIAHKHQLVLFQFLKLMSIFCIFCN